MAGPKNKSEKLSGRVDAWDLGEEEMIDGSRSQQKLHLFVEKDGGHLPKLHIFGGIKMLNIFRCISMVFYGFFKKDWKISRPSGSKCGNSRKARPSSWWRPWKKDERQQVTAIFSFFQANPVGFLPFHSTVEASFPIRFRYLIHFDTSIIEIIE